MEYNISNVSAGENNTSSGTYEFYQTEQLVFLCVLFAMIVVGNTLVLTTIILSGKRRSRMNLFIINLACADLSVGCVLVLSDIIWKTTITWYAGNIGCKLVKFSQCSATYGATYALVVMSLDRLDAIARPMNMSGVERRCRLLIILSWTFAALFSLPMVFIYEQRYVEGVMQCWLELPEMWMWQLYVTSISLAVFIIPAVIIATCYILIVIIIWSKSSMQFVPASATRCSERSVCLPQNGSMKVRFTDPYNKTNKQSASSSRGVIPRAKIKTIKMTFVIVLAFILCWSPYFIWDLLSVYGYLPQSQEIIATSTFVQSLAPLNSAANPLIYTLFNTVICKRIFKKHQSFHSPPQSRAPVTTSTTL